MLEAKQSYLPDPPGNDAKTAIRDAIRTVGKMRHLPTLQCQNMRVIAMNATFVGRPRLAFSEQ
jgi:hypothetical protein